jgi:(R)-2-hydroxyglutarate---pyruvate transhydrogenase
MKAQFLNYTKTDLSIEYMKQIKKVFDPKGILNPYKIFA